MMPRLLLGLAVLVCLRPNAATAQTIRAIVDPRIAVHARQKTEAFARPDAARNRFLSWHGLTQDRRSEQLAIHVTARLDRLTEAVWVTRGIELDPDLWVPPVPGHHPLGYHLARVPYDQVAWLAQQVNVQRLTSVEIGSHRHNDLVRAMLKAEEVQAGNGVKATSGAGVKLCVADSSLDTTHLDIPKPAEAYDVTTGNSVSKWSKNVTSQVTEHGTHVTGIAVGNGHWSQGQYRGVAPGASLYFYKIADNTTGSSSDADEIRAIQRAITVGCRVFSMSYGQLGSALDGADPVEQAVDAAVTQGMAVFVSAGNEADGGVHTSVHLQPGQSAQVQVKLDNSAGATDLADAISFGAAWRDETPGDDNVTVSAKGLNSAESWTDDGHVTSARDTDYHAYELAPSVAASETGTWTLTLKNKANGSATWVHVYIDDPNVSTFFADGGDPAYTVNSPAVADLAIAVGAVVQRRTWTDWQGQDQDSGPDYVNGNLAPFSSRGPRIDGVRKPDLLAPGSMTISVRDSQIQLDDTTLIDDDGAMLNGKDPAHYLAEDGTSMATPAAAGAAALLAAAVPSLTAQSLVAYLTGTAAQAGAPDDKGGFGLVNVQAAIQKAACEVGGDCAAPSEDAGGTEEASAATDAMSADVGASDAVAPQTPAFGNGSASALGCTAGARAPAALLSVCAAIAVLGMRRRRGA